MKGLGTIINVSLIILGGLFGSFFGRRITERFQTSLTKSAGVSVLFLGIAGAMEGMLKVEGNMIVSGKAVFIVVSIILGTLLGELADIEGLFEKFGVWLKVKSGNAKDKNFVEGFLTASFTVCIGAMAIVGSIEDGINGDYSILFTKAILDMIIVMVMTAGLGKGPVFSFIPVALLQGGVTALSGLMKPIMTDAALANLSMVGSILIFCVGMNLVFGKTVKVANMLPSVVLAVAATFLPVNL